MSVIRDRNELLKMRQNLKQQNKKLVFTNGCFDILHSGHVDYLAKARQLGDFLIVGLNSDDSIHRIKGDKRPILQETERAFLLDSLKCVDFVTLFNEDTPEQLIDFLIPDILVKGADWSLDKIAGRETVIANGGEVKTIEFVNMQSTSKIIDLIVQRYSK